MMCRSDTICCLRKRSSRAFTIPEVTGALVILGLVCAMIFPIIRNSMEAYSQNCAKLEAFQVARENMETLLASGTVTEKVDYGISDKNPNIEWETTVEPFSLDDGMWLRAICSASYLDANDQPQKVELTYWLTQIPKDVAAQIMKDRQLSDSNEVGSPQDFNEPGMLGQNSTNDRSGSRDRRNNPGRPGDNSQRNNSPGSSGNDQLQQFLNRVQRNR